MILVADGAGTSSPRELLKLLDEGHREVAFDNFSSSNPELLCDTECVPARLSYEASVDQGLLGRLIVVKVFSRCKDFR